jgi:hypothetical protein
MALEWARVIVQLLSAVLWPVAVFCIALIFRPEIQEFLRRVRKVHGAGIDLEADAAERLTQQTLEVKEDQYPDEPRKQPPIDATPAQAIAAFAKSVTTIDRPTKFEELLVAAASTPRSAAVTVRHLVESELRRLLAATGRLSRAGPEMRQLSFSKLLEEAQQTKLLSQELIDSIRQFRILANGLIHGEQDEPDAGAEITAAGLNIVRALRSIPHQRNFVEQPNVPIYSDAECTFPATGHGIILKAVIPPDNLTVHYIYPTTRDHFQKGKEVAWEWNSARIWGPAWFRDSQTGRVEQAWSASSEFVGRHLEDV